METVKPKSRRERTAPVLREIHDEEILRTSLYGARIPKKYWRASLLKRDNNYSINSEVANWQLHEAKKGLAFITGIKGANPVSYNEYRRVYLTYARDLVVHMDVRAIVVTVQELMTMATDKGSAYYFDCLEDVGYPRHIFLDGFWDVTLESRTFPEGDTVRVRYIQFVRRLMDDNFLIYPFCYQHLNPASGWYTKALVEDIKAATEAFTL